MYEKKEAQREERELLMLVLYRDVVDKMRVEVQRDLLATGEICLDNSIQFTFEWV